MFLIIIKLRILKSLEILFCTRIRHFKMYPNFFFQFVQQKIISWYKDLSMDIGKLWH